MVGIAVDSQVAKYYSRKRKARLAYYGLLVSLFLSLSTLGSGPSLSSLFSLLLTLPLPLYFALQSLKLYRKTRLRPSIIDHEPVKFSFAEFISQPNWDFRFSLLLFFLVCFTMLSRIQSSTPTLTMNSQPLSLSAQAGINH